MRPFSRPTFDQSDRSGAAGGEFPAQRIERLQLAVRTLLKSTGWSNADASRRSDISSATFSEWMRGTYKGNMLAIADKVEKWLATEDAAFSNQSALITDPGYVETSMSRQVVQALTFAQSSPTMAIITMGSGFGKTMAFQWYAANRTHAYRVAIEPVEGKPHKMLRKIGRAIGVPEQFRISDYADKIAERLRRDGGRQPLLMIDEAQNLDDQAVNQLRFLLDEARCGLALAGNEDLMARYSLSATREGYGQIHRRVGVRVHVKSVPSDDVDLMLNALSVLDPEMRRLAHQIALRPGGLGQVVDTCKLASLIAFGGSREMTAADIKTAWQNRSREDLR
jgi:DNA transposition AAA+ family ATPase